MGQGDWLVQQCGVLATFLRRKGEIRSRDAGGEGNFFYLIMLQAESREPKGREVP